MSAAGARRTARAIAAAAAVALLAAACTDPGPQLGVGVTEEPCPNAVNRSNGCIFLGSVIDKGPRSSGVDELSRQVGRAAFWDRVNEQGGVAGFDVDVRTFARRGDGAAGELPELVTSLSARVLAMAYVAEDPRGKIVRELRASGIVAVPSSSSSAYERRPEMLETGASTCVQVSNGLDYHVELGGGASSVLAVHLADPDGIDAAAGARLWAEANSAAFAAVAQRPLLGGGTTAGAVAQIIERAPDVVVLGVGPQEAAAIIAGAVAQGFPGRFLGSLPSWSATFIDEPVFETLEQQYWQVGPWAPWDTDTLGHGRMRAGVLEASAELGDAGHTAGWVASYAMKALLEQAVADGALTRDGLLASLGSLRTVNHDEMLPDGAGRYVGNGTEQSFMRSVIARPDEATDDGLVLYSDGFFEGPTAATFSFGVPCSES